MGWSCFQVASGGYYDDIVANCTVLHTVLKTKQIFAWPIVHTVEYKKLLSQTVLLMHHI